MNVNNIYKIGKSHKKCDDFSYSTDLIPLIIVSDGCSSSPDTNIGSQLLTSIIKTNIKRNFLVVHDLFSKKSIIQNVTEQFDQSLSTARKIAVDLLGLTPESLDCTFLVAFPVGNDVFCFSSGDGFIYTKTKDKRSQMVEINYNNYPYYLNYEFDESRRNNYLKMGNRAVLNYFTIDQQENLDLSKSVNEEPNQISVEVYPKDELESITISTDGIGTFYNSKQQEAIDPVVIFKQLHSSSLTKGEYLERSLFGISKKFPEYDHYDDLGIATILFD